MCGIIGAISLGGAALDISPEAFDRARDLMSHRGPDDAGSWWSENRRVAFGHRRLSIIDLSAAGHQPMTNEDGTVWITYNGEVYNFAELRAELIERGHRFSSNTDTEAIIHGYEEFGPDVVQRLRGMFAFAIHDTRTGRTMLARDRVGIKPLYYAVAGRDLVFGSEIKALLAHPRFAKRLDGDSLREYLVFGKVHSPKSMFEGVEKLGAGHYMIIDADGTRITTRFWTPYDRALDLPPDGDEAYYAGRLLEHLEESVRLRMVSDVPVGVFLSGGVDSTANLALMSKISGERIRTFTCGFRGQASYDEREIARAAAKHYGAIHQEIEIGERDLVEALPGLAYYLDEPVSDPTVIPIYFLSKLAHETDTTVILNGDGSDEIFCGYGKYLKYLRMRPWWNSYNRIPRPLRRAVSRIGTSLGVDGVAGDFLERSARGVEMFVGGTSAIKGVPGFRSILAGEGRDVYSAVSDERRAFERMRAGDDYAEWLSYWGMRSEVEETFLYRADRMGMASSVEIRVPFLDHRMVEFAMQMPQHFKYRNGTGKYLLKKALEGTVPDEFLYRRKMGFCVPVREWAGGMMNDEIMQVLPKIASHWGGLDERMIAGIETELKRDDGSSTATTLGWDLYALATWYRRWFT